MLLDHHAIAQKLAQARNNMAKNIVGKRYVGWDGNVYLCESYDPCLGFWMQEINAPANRRNISERAIGTTYHRVKMTYGAWCHLEMYEKLGRIPTLDEVCVERLLADLTIKSLVQNGLIASDGSLTDRGRQALASQERVDLALHLEF